MIPDRVGQHEVLLPINHNLYNFRKKNSFIWENISNEDIVKSKKFLVLEFLEVVR